MTSDREGLRTLPAQTHELQAVGSQILRQAERTLADVMRQLGGSGLAKANIIRNRGSIGVSSNMEKAFLHSQMQ